MQSNWILTCVCADTIIDISFDYERDHRCIWRNEITSEVLLVLEKKDIWWIEDGNTIGLKRQPLRLHTLYHCKVDEKVAYLFCEPQDQASRIFQFYKLDKEHTYTIGRKNCDIVYDCAFLSEQHASLFYESKHWNIQDLHSANGTYVNLKRTQMVALTFGDSMYFMGMWIILMDDFIAINNPMQCVSVDTKVCTTYEIEDTYPQTRSIANRKLGFREIIEPYNIKTYSLLPPPILEQQEKTPILYMLGPSITMGLASVTSAVFMMMQSYKQSNSIQSAIPSLIMAFSMVLGTFVWPLVYQRYERRKEVAKEQKRQSIYTAYLEEKQLEIHRDMQMYKAKLHEIFPKDRNLVLKWQYQQINGAPMLCFGYGDQQIAIPWEKEHSRQISLHEDMLIEKGEYFKTKKQILQNIPLTSTLDEYVYISIDASESLRVSYGRYMIYQLSNTYDSTQFQLVIACSMQEQELHAIRFLPHLFHDTQRFLCHNEQQAKKLVQLFSNVDKPLVIVSFIPACTKVFLTFINEHKQGTLLAFHDEISTVQITLEQYTGSFLHNLFTWFPIHDSTFLQINECPNQQMEDTYPAKVGLLAMYHVHTCAHLEIEKRWDEAKPYQSLRVALGVYANREICYLDIHEKAHGPHGILAGMTGSGKSELLVTLLLSLAISYHPHDVSFVLIDYKGGGMAKTLEYLPHTAGIITNLDGSMIERSLCALNSEVIRRQQIFVNTMKELHTSSMDIYAYQKFCKEGKNLEPLPHLLIVSDEFAELKQQQPQFMEQLIRLARIGRSLGLHLLLATQKPAGIVDDQIWSNARFHICMKVAEKSDSMDMLKREDGALLTACGRFYLQVGYNEIFEEGQSAYAKLPYVEGEFIDETWIRQVDDLNDEVNYWEREVVSKQHENELQAVLHRIQTIASTKNIQPITLWLPPLKQIQVTNNEIPGYLVMVDDPVQQRQFPLQYHLEDMQNTLVYAMHPEVSEQAIETFLYALLTQYQASELCIVIMDMGQGKLSTFSTYPQFFACVNEEDHDDIEYLLYWLLEQLHKRKKQPNEKVILFVLHHYIVFRELYEKFDDMVYQILRDGPRYGVYVLLSAQSLQDMRYRYHTQFTQTFCFPLSDKNMLHEILGEYRSIDNCAGRALWKKENIYEVQFVTYEETYCRKQVKKSKKGIEQMPDLPHHVKWDMYDHKNTFRKHHIAIGLMKKSRVPLFIHMQSTWMISGSKAPSFLKSMKHQCDEQSIPLQILHAQEIVPLAIEEPAILTMIEIPISLISTCAYAEWFQQLQRDGNFLWIGHGLKEVHYLFNIQEEIREVTNNDGYLLHQTCDEVRFMED